MLSIIVNVVTGILVFYIGILTGLSLRKRTTYGDFLIDTSNPEKDVYRLEIKDLDKVSSKKYITLKVCTDAKLSDPYMETNDKEYLRR